MPVTRVRHPAPGLALGALAWLALCVAAASEPVPSEEPPRRVYTTRHLNGGRVTLDGRPEEPAWERVPWAGDFTQRSPYEGRAPSQETEFKILYDDQAL